LKKITFDNSDNDFTKTLRSRVKEYFAQNNLQPTANGYMKFKTILILSVYFTCYALAVFGNFSTPIVLGLCVMLGVSAAAIGFNVMHDAAHGSYSKNGFINRILGYSMDLLGASVMIWKTKHNLVHHTYTNVPEMDADIAQVSVIRLEPSVEVRWFHRFQHIYSFALYSMLSLIWVFYTDFDKLAKKRIGGYPLPRPKKQDVMIMFALKVFHIFYTLVLPSFFYNFWAVLGCYIFAHLVLGLILSIVFQLAHIYEGTNYPTPNPETLQIENEWYKHQVETTANFAPTSRLLNFYVGGLNFQVEHHLFPNICHVHYPKINKIVKETCEEFGVGYKEYKTFFSALKSHYRQLKIMGKPEMQAVQA
jgi:linoleoyl-CoA desaturase